MKLDSRVADHVSGVEHGRLGPVYIATTALSAFLLFQIQPLIAKLILPWFGGGASVWSVCLLFFQVVLLLGYLYAHLLTKHCRVTTQSIVHATLAAFSLLALPVVLPAALKPIGSEDPSLRILLVLAASIGLPYFVLSSTSPLLQVWHSQIPTHASPYRLYALSNAGSLLALLTYPFLFEPFISAHHQAILWSMGYGGFVLGISGAAFSHKSVRVAASDQSAGAILPGRLRLLWIALAGCASTVLLSVTSYLSQNIAAVPFLWVLPLSLYLLTFILCFEEPTWYRRSFFLRFFAVGLAAMAYVLGDIHRAIPPLIVISVFCTGLFACCMVCHGELAALRPPAARLTSFYLYVALGGSIGSFFVAIAAPHVFSGYYELPVALGSCGLLIHIVMRREGTTHSSSWWSDKRSRLLASAMVVALCASLIVTTRREAKRFRSSARNFYGVLKIEDVPGPPIVFLQGGVPQSLDGGPGYRELVNGTIEHGIQFLTEHRRREATSYYGPQSGAAFALRAAGTHGALKIAVIGLGTGTLATYGRLGDRITFYEINPLVVELANRDFSFLRDSHAKINIVQGDARLALEREPDKQFDVLVVDAFSGDAIPTHLLTHEAFEVYLHHLSPRGLLAVHVSNRYLDLAPVVLAAAQRLRLEVKVIENTRDPGHAIYAATWVVIGQQSALSELPQPSSSSSALSLPRNDRRLWTDDYSSVLRNLRW